MPASEPTVCCIMLTKDRPELAARAVRCFRAQTYANKKLLIIDSGRHVRFDGMPADDIPFLRQKGDVRCLLNAVAEKTIGSLRNTAASLAGNHLNAEVIIHFDDDDYSHSNRIAEQVALLQSGDYDAVGYREMLFYRNNMVEFDKSFADQGFGTVTETEDAIEIETGELVEAPGEAYLYSHGKQDYIIGTSLCYWRRTWEQKPFDNNLPNAHCGEDFVFQSGLRIKSVTSVGMAEQRYDPRMIACVHGGNTKIDNYNDAMRTQNCFKRAPNWDRRVNEILSKA